MMNITINDLEMNSTLDQAAMTELLGGFSLYGSWRVTGVTSYGIRAGRKHMGRKHYFFGSKRWTRRGHQHGKKWIKVSLKRSVRQYGWG